MNSADELISRHLDGANTPDETAALDSLIASDQATARALVRAARVEVMLQRSLPRQRSRAPLRWALTAAAAALVTGSVLAVRMLVPPPGPQPADTTAEIDAEAEEKWVPVEKVERLPIREINPAARAQWTFWQDAREESRVPLPKPRLRWEEKKDELNVEGKADYAREWGLKRREAKIVEMDSRGVIDLGDGYEVSLKLLALRVPGFASPDFSLQPAVFSDPAGQPLEGRQNDVSNMGGALRFAGTGSRIMLALQPPAGKEIQVLGMDVFQPESGIWLTGGSGGSSLVKGELRTGVEALLTSRAPVIIALELGIPTAPPVILPAKEGASASAGFAEARIVRVQQGAWKYSGGALPKKPQESIRLHFVPQPVTDSPDQHCLIGLNLSPGLAVRIAARTAGGLRQADLKSDSWNRLVRFASFDVPAASIESLEVQPLTRRRVFIRYTPPVDPWQGAYREVDDALDLRIPAAAPNVWPCTVIERLTGSAETELTDLVSGRKIFITSELRNATIREVLAHYATSSQGGRLEVEPRLRRFRMARE